MSLVINLGRIRNAKGTTANYELTVSDFNLLSTDFKLAKPLKIFLMATNTGRTIELKGYVQTELKSKCSRCLNEVSIPINTFIEEELVYFSDIRYFEGLSHEEIEEKYFIYDNDIFDLTHLVRENIIFALPFKILCSDECKGLCSVCGQNLNIKECDCTTEEIDPRLAVLAKLKERN